MKRSAAKPISAGPQAFAAAQTKSHINQLCQCLAQEFQPEKIILFGSYAYGQPHHFSDIDLLVIMPFEGSPFRQAGMILHRVIQQVGVLPLDLLVRTSEQIKERLALGDNFIGEIMQRGKVLYEANYVGMD